jgi:hypothetical protein
MTRIAALFLTTGLGSSIGCAAEEGDGFEFRAAGEVEPDILIYGVPPQPPTPGKKKKPPPPPPPSDDDLLIWRIRDGISVDLVDGGTILNLAAPYIYDGTGTPRCVVEGNELDPVIAVSAFGEPESADPLFVLEGNEVYDGSDSCGDPLFSYHKQYVFLGPRKNYEYLYQADTNLRAESTFRKLLIAALASGTCGAPEPP